MYMGERLQYYHRRHDAETFPTTVWSAISDGMAQAHNMLPHLGNLATFSNPLPQHLQGVLVHGVRMLVYRTFHNVANGANLAIHTMLLTLEKLFTVAKRMPETFYYQIDGGSENTAKCMFGICELLVARGLICNIALTRLPVGHTHEDIDSKFGKIWLAMRSRHVCTMSQYATVIVGALGSDRSPCDVIDLFAVPDYKSYIEPFMDSKFGRYAKEQWTQLQWKFTRIDKSRDFPLGVKITYRAYAADTVCLVSADESKEYGFNVENVEVIVQPAASTGQVEGLYLLEKFPTGQIKPDGFVKDSRELLDSCLAKVRSTFGMFKVDENPNSVNTVVEWNDFSANIAPQSNNVQEYCLSHPLYIPFEDILFGANNAVDYVTFVPVKEPKKTRTTACVSWRNRGVTRNKNDPGLKGPRVDIDAAVPSSTTATQNK